MAAMTFTVPLVNGMTEHWKQAVAQLTGPRAAEHAASRQRAGITRELVCLQHTPMGDMVCVMLEGSDPMGSMKTLMESQDPFDRWFAKTVFVESHGMTPTDQPPVPEVMIDWKA